MFTAYNNLPKFKLKYSIIQFNLFSNSKCESLQLVIL